MTGRERGSVKEGDVGGGGMGLGEMIGGTGAEDAGADY